MFLGVPVKILWDPYCRPLVVVVVVVLDDCPLVYHFRNRLVVVVVVGTAALLLQQFVLDRVVNVEPRNVVRQLPVMVAAKHRMLRLTVEKSKDKLILDNNNNNTNESNCNDFYNDGIAIEVFVVVIS